jgi:hypothetical protein
MIIPTGVSEERIFCVTDRHSVIRRVEASLTYIVRFVVGFLVLKPMHIVAFITKNGESLLP